jgi:hypothetical protein
MSGVHGSSYLKTVLGEKAKYKLDSVGVEKVRCDKSGTEPADDCTFLYGNGNTTHNIGTGFFVHKGSISTIKRA